MSGDNNLNIEQIYNKFGKLIFSIAYSYTHDYQSSEDILQETIKKIIKVPTKTNNLSENALRNYIARIVVNTSLDYLRKANREVLMPDNDLSENDIEDNFDLEEYVITSNTKELLKDEIRKLDVKYRDPLTLHNLYGYTISEVSELLGVPERTVKHRINKAIKILKSIFLKGGGNNER